MPLAHPHGKEKQPLGQGLLNNLHGKGTDSGRAVLGSAEISQRQSPSTDDSGLLKAGHLGAEIDFGDKITTRCALARINCLASKIAEVKLPLCPNYLLL